MSEGETTPDPFEEARQAAEDALARGAPQDAFRSFRRELWYPAPGFASRPERLGPALALLARIFDTMGHGELAAATARAADDLGDPEALYDLGYALIDAGLPAIGAVVLTRCLQVAPGSEPVLTELVSALERRLAYADARALLEAHPQLVEASFMCRYLLAYNAAMTGDLAATRAHAARLVPGDDGQAFMAARIAAILDRADRVAGACRLDASDLRGWHYVLTGGVLTHLSPYGFEEPMRGRYAWLQDSAARVRTGVDRLMAILRAWEIAPACVYAPPGRDHEIVAAVVAAVAGVPMAPWPAVGLPAPGLVAVYDLGSVEWRDLERLVERRPGQVLFAHASPWTDDGPVAPDVTTLLHQTVASPWGERLVFDPSSAGDGGAGAGSRREPPDPRDPAEIAAEIAASAGLDADETAVDDVDRLDALIGRAGGPLPGRRERLWAGSPVLSNRFD